MTHPDPVPWRQRPTWHLVKRYEDLHTSPEPSARYLAEDILEEIHDRGGTVR